MAIFFKTGSDKADRSLSLYWYFSFSCFAFSLTFSLVSGYINCSILSYLFRILFSLALMASISSREGTSFPIMPSIDRMRLMVKPLAKS